MSHTVNKHYCTWRTLWLHCTHTVHQDSVAGVKNYPPSARSLFCTFLLCFLFLTRRKRFNFRHVIILVAFRVLLAWRHAVEKVIEVISDGAKRCAFFWIGSPTRLHQIIPKTTTNDLYIFFKINSSVVWWLTAQQGSSLQVAQVSFHFLRKLRFLPIQFLGTEFDREWGFPTWQHRNSTASKQSSNYTWIDQSFF